MASFQLRLSLLKQFCKSGRILDIGCATGYFLEAAQQEGYEPFGVEYSGWAARIAQDKFGTDNIFTGILEQSHWEQGSFDIITMFDLFEHVRHPAQMLSLTASLLKKDGLIMIMTPDTGSLSHAFMTLRLRIEC